MKGTARCRAGAEHRIDIIDEFSGMEFWLAVMPSRARSSPLDRGPCSVVKRAPTPSVLRRRGAGGRENSWSPGRASGRDSFSLSRFSHVAGKNHGFAHRAACPGPAAGSSPCNFHAQSPCAFSSRVHSPSAVRKRFSRAEFPSWRGGRPAAPPSRDRSPARCTGSARCAGVLQQEGVMGTSAVQRVTTKYTNPPKPEGWAIFVYIVCFRVTDLRSHRVKPPPRRALCR